MGKSRRSQVKCRSPWENQLRHCETQLTKGEKQKKNTVI
jgi:hypothetical protein